MLELTLMSAALLWPLVAFLALLGCAYSLFAAALLRRFVKTMQRAAVPACPALTVLKPLCGAEPNLEAILSSFCQQDYSGHVQIVCGVQSAADPAIAVVRQLIERFPAEQIELVADPELRGTNRKISNVVNMMAKAEHDIIVLSDSDIGVAPDYLDGVVGALLAPGVGLVTCLYRGIPARGLWSQLAALAIDQQFLPGVLVGLRFGLARPCFGSTIALRTDTLERIGGFEAFANLLADDYAIGAAVRALDLSVAVPPLLVEHFCGEDSAAELAQHELRWGRTLRSIDPFGYAGFALANPLPFALAAAGLQGFGAAGIGLILLSLACRLLIPLQLPPKRGMGQRRALLWLSPIRDLLSFAIAVASFLPGPVIWRGNRFELRPDGTLSQN